MMNNRGLSTDPCVLHKWPVRFQTWYAKLVHNVHGQEEQTWNINRQMSEELLSHDRRVENHLTTPGFEPLTFQSLAKSTVPSAISPFLLLCGNRFYFSNKLYFGVRTIEIIQKWRTKAWKGHLRSQRMF